MTAAGARPTRPAHESTRGCNHRSASMRTCAGTCAVSQRCARRARVPGASAAQAARIASRGSRPVHRQAAVGARRVATPPRSQLQIAPDVLPGVELRGHAHGGLQLLQPRAQPRLGRATAGSPPGQPAGVTQVPGERAGGAGQGGGQRHPHPHLVVTVVAHRRVETTDLVEHRAGHHGGRAAPGNQVHRDLAALHPRLRRRVPAHHAQILVDGHRSRGDPAGPWGRVERLQLAAQLVRRPQVVVVEEGHPRGGGGGGAGVAGGARPTVRLGRGDRAHPLVVELVDQRAGEVTLTVVDDHDLHPDVALPEHRAQRAGQQVRPVVRRDDHRHGRSCRRGCRGPGRHRRSIPTR